MRAMARAHSPYGDGRAAERIASVLSKKPVDLAVGASCIFGGDAQRLENGDLESDAKPVPTFSKSSKRPPMTARPAPSKEVARLRLYILSILIDLAMLGIAFALANVMVLGSLMGEPGKPHGLVMFAMIAPVYALIAINGGAYGIRMIGNRQASAVKAVWSLVQAALLTLIIIYFGKIAEQLSRLTFLVGLLGRCCGLVCRAASSWSGSALALLGEVPHFTVLLVDGVEVAPPREAHLHFREGPRFRSDQAHRARWLKSWRGALVGPSASSSPARPSAWRPGAWRLTALSAKGEILVPEMTRFAPAKVSQFDDHPTLVVAGGPLLFRDRLLKRLLDIVASFVRSWSCSPVLIAAAIAVRLSGPGPVLFRQARMGKDAHPLHDPQVSHHACRAD